MVTSTKLTGANMSTDAQSTVVSEPSTSTTHVEPGQKGHAFWGPEKWLELARSCQYLPENDMHALCHLVAQRMQDEPNVVEVSSPVTICGDIHGQYYDLEELLLKSGGEPPQLKFVFLGDYVDRGYYSLETLTRLLTLKAVYPAHVTLIRGNHETRQITQVYGFYDECQRKYGNAAVWRSCCHIFDLMPIAALIDDAVLCVHGGLSPQIKLLDQIYTIERESEIPQKGAFCDLMWSDPEEAVESWMVSPRGAGWLFGRQVADKFRHDNGLELIARAHQLVMEGYKYLWDDTVVTVWSAPNYCYRCGNVAAVLHVRGPTAAQCEAVVFDAVDDDNRQKPDRNPAPYFL